MTYRLCPRGYEFCFTFIFYDFHFSYKKLYVLINNKSLKKFTTENSKHFELFNSCHNIMSISTFYFIKIYILKRSHLNDNIRHTIYNYIHL